MAYQQLFYYDRIASQSEGSPISAILVWVSKGYPQNNPEQKIFPRMCHLSVDHHYPILSSFIG